MASTGGQIDPPVMGAAAFLMAEYLQVPYAEVMVAAIIPALLYHSALFMQVDLESAKLGILGAPRETLPSVWKVLREGWHGGGAEYCGEQQSFHSLSPPWVSFGYCSSSLSDLQSFW